MFAPCRSRPRPSVVKEANFRWRLPVAAVAAFEAQDGPTPLTQGSSRLVHQLLPGSLVDELRLLSFALVLGAGKRKSGRLRARTQRDLAQQRR